MRPARRLVTLLALGAALLASDAVAQPQPGATGGDLTDRYPLGDRTLESGAPRRVLLPPPAERPAAVDAPPADDGSGTRMIVIAVAAVVFLAIAGAAAQEALEVGWFARTAPRPRRVVAPQTYRVARLLGFRYSYRRDALVLRGVGERFGPVLTCRGERSRPPPPRR